LPQPIRPCLPGDVAHDRTAFKRQGVIMRFSRQARKVDGRRQYENADEPLMTVEGIRMWT
jgi:hypothetical protein